MADRNFYGRILRPVSHINIGDVHVAQGKLAAALDSYEASLAAFYRLAKADPGNAG